jgi:hypothetical protein
MCRCPERDKLRSLPRTPTPHGSPPADAGALGAVADRLLSVACTLLEQQTLFDPSYEVRDAAGA